MKTENVAESHRMFIPIGHKTTIMWNLVQVAVHQYYYGYTEEKQKLKQINCTCHSQPVTIIMQKNNSAFHMEVYVIMGNRSLMFNVTSYSAALDSDLAYQPDMQHLLQ